MRYPQRAANSATKYVEQTRIWLGLTTALFDVIQAVEIFVVPVKFEETAVELISASLGHVVYDRALVAAILCREIVSDNLKFLNGILIINKERRPGDAEVVIVGAVDLKIVR